MMEAFKNKIVINMLLIGVFLLASIKTFAADNSIASNDEKTAYFLLAILVAQLLAILAIGSAIKGIVKATQWKQGKNFKKLFSIVALIGFSFLSYDSFAAGASESFFEITSIGNNVLIVANIVLAVILISLITILKGLMNSALGISEEEDKSVFESITESLTDSIDLEEEDSIMMDHEYDGIRELDNNLPPWWKYMFYLTIVFGVIYIFYYHMGDGLSQKQEYDSEMQVAEAQKAAFLEKLVNSINENNVTYLTDGVSLKEGGEIFTTYCATCHRADGGGMPGSGPNLTDEYWKNGGGIKNVFSVIKYGVTEKGMISWKDQFTPLQIQQVASYVMSIQGTNPIDAKASEGDKWTDEKTSLEVEDKKGILNDSTLQVTDTLVTNVTEDESK